MSGFFGNNPPDTVVGSTDATESTIAEDAVEREEETGGFFQGSPTRSVVEAQEADARESAADAEAAQAAAETAQAAAEASEVAAQTSASNAATNATAAATSASNASTSATNAAASSTTAASEATDAANSASNAASSASAASASATTAANEATDAEASATAAASSETLAAGSATTATTKASEASTSATAAANSETAAAASETAAAASETAAAASETAAAASETAAATSETNAATSATNSATSATNAATSETNAASSATAAAASATSAAGSATTATTKASEASTSATNAAASETAAAASEAAAAGSETAAAASETAAAASETAAAASETAAAASESAAATSETNAASSATAAATSASNAATSESNASTSATSASTSASTATAAKDAALAALDSFDDRYLGVKTSGPTVDNDGNALVSGALYFNSTDNAMKVYDGSNWLNAYASLSGALLANQNLSDLNNVATARTNLGLGTAATTAATDYATAAQGTKADTAHGWGNHASAGYLTSYTETDPTVPSHVKNITTTNIGNWNTAYGWGNHASAGYLTSYTETDTLATVTGRGATTTSAISSGAFTSSGNVTATGFVASSSTPAATMLSLGSSSQSDYTLAQWKTSAHVNTEAYILAYGAGHSSQAGHFAMKNLEPSKDIFFELYGGVEALRLSSTGATFAGTISSGAITSTGNLTALTGTFTGQNGTALNVNSGTTNVAAKFESTDDEVWINLKDNNSGTYGALLGHADDALFKVADSSVNVRMSLSGAGLLDTDAGFSVAGTTVIDSSLNLTNIGTISSGSHTITSSNGSFDALNLGSSTQSGYTNVVWFTNSGNAQIWKSGTLSTSYGGASSLNIYNSNNVIAFHPMGVQNVLKLDNGGMDVGSGRNLRFNGTTVIDAARNISAQSYNYGNASYKLHAGDWGFRHTTPNGWIQFGPANSNYAHIYTDRGNFYFNVNALYANGNTMWHAGNDGSGSGLDADTLDTYQASQFLRSDASDSFTASHLSFPTLHLNISNNNTTNGYNTYFRGDSSHFVLGLANGNTFYCNYGNVSGNFRLDGNVYHNNSLVGNKIWGNSNDGPGSGLDADTLDTYQASHFAIYDHIRSLGTQALNNGSSPYITTSQVMDEIDGFGGFDSYTSVFKTSWSYAGNYNLTDAGRFTETAGTSWITWTDTASDSTRGNITALAIAPTTGGSAGRVFIYNNQGSNYSPGWREVWTSTSDGSGSGLDADLLDGYDMGENGVDKILKTNGSGYLDLQNWINITTRGIYSNNTNGAYFTPNTTSSYATWKIDGSRGGYGGLQISYAGGGNNNGVHLMYDASGNGGMWSNANTGGWAYYYHRGRRCLGVGGSTTSSSYGIYEQGGGIYSTANVTASGFLYSSDRAFKRDIKPIKNALETVSALQGVTYVLKKTEEDSVGFIAQDVEQVVPELVKGEEGEKTVNYGQMVALLTEAIKEQQAQIESLKAEIAGMKNAN